MSLTTVDQGLLGTYAQYTGFKNRIINGAMMIDQRNAGASVTPTDTSNWAYTLDRFATRISVASKFSVQQNAGSVTPPAGFKNYLGVTSLSSYSVGASEFFLLGQIIEGLNIADLAWGTASAATVTLSFKVYSSLTGTFGGSIYNNGASRVYPFSYTVSSANTWTTISVTIPGDTSGTWLTTSGIGMQVVFSLGTGSTYLASSSAWGSTGYYGFTGQQNVVGTNGATFYITGVQLEKGSTATSFDYRPYGTELALCQRYYQKSYAIGTVPGTSVGSADACIEVAWANDVYNGIGASSVMLPVVLRASGTLTIYDAVGNSGKVSTLSSGAAQTDNQGINTSNATTTKVFVRIYGIACAGFGYMYTVSAEL